MVTKVVWGNFTHPVTFRGLIVFRVRHFSDCYITQLDEFIATELQLLNTGSLALFI